MASARISLHQSILRHCDLRRRVNPRERRWRRLSEPGRESVLEFGGERASKRVCEIRDREEQGGYGGRSKGLAGTYVRSPVVLASGKGCKLYDVEGREYLDLNSGIAVNALGQCDSDWVNAVVEQANTLTHVSNVYYSLLQVELAKRLVASSFADRAFFTNSGTEANETAIKFSRKFSDALTP